MKIIFDVDRMIQKDKQKLMLKMSTHFLWAMPIRQAGHEQRGSSSID